MPRKPREIVAGGIYHVYARGNGRCLVFIDSTDKRIYLHYLGKVTVWGEWRCLSYCLMANHVHLLLETPQGNLSAGMQRLQGAYTQKFNARHGRSGHLFEGRFGAKRIKDDAQLTAVVRYIAENPVEAGLCARPEEWRWGSHRARVLGGSGPDWLDTPRLAQLLDGAARGPAEPSLQL